MLWAAIALPELSLSAVFRAGDEGPCAVFDGPENRPQLLNANAAAAAFGVRAGQTPAAAHALAGGLRLRRRDRAAEAKLLEHLAAWAYGYSGMVALLPPDALLLEVGASLRLFRGWPALERQLREGLTELGHAHRLAAAPTPLGARVLADVADGTAVNDEGRLLTALGHVAVGAAHLPEKTVAALTAMGLRQLRDVVRLPRPELARRVGREALEHIDRLRGSLADPRELYRPPDRFTARIEFDSEIETTQPLLFPLLRLTRELAAFLLARDGGVQTFELLIEHEQQTQEGKLAVRVQAEGGTRTLTRVPIGLLEPVRAAEALFEFARGRLERLELPAPARALALEAKALPPFVPTRRDLFDIRPGAGLDWPQLAERLRARLGDKAVRGFALHPDHRPERAWRTCAAIAATRAGSSARTAASTRSGSGRTSNNARNDNDRTNNNARTVSIGTDAPSDSSRHDNNLRPRPIWLLPRPLPLRGHVARLVSGPERIETGWWDGYDVRRDYYVADLSSGQRAWLYREVGGDDWMLQGWFA